MRHRGTVLVDTNAILAAHRVRGWRALTGHYPVETVENCVTETQTGFQQRSREQRIDIRDLRARLASVHSVTRRDRAELELRVPHIHLDFGEAALWAHALCRKDDWVLCGPDKASLRCGICLGHRERLASLERLLQDAGHRPRIKLRNAYTQRWLDQTLNKLVLEERRTWDSPAPAPD